MTRREAREQAFILVFEQAVREEPMDGILHDAAEVRDFVPGSFAEGEALGVEAHQQEIDQLIEGTSGAGACGAFPRWLWLCCAWQCMR